MLANANGGGVGGHRGPKGSESGHSRYQGEKGVTANGLWGAALTPTPCRPPEAPFQQLLASALPGHPGSTPSRGFSPEPALSLG